MRHDQNIGKQDRSVEPEATDRLQGNLGRYKRCPETGKLLDSIPGLSLAFGPCAWNAHQGPSRELQGCTQVPSWIDRVGDKMIYWEEGKCVIGDDTHKHEVWNDTDGIRVVLLFDFWRLLPGWLTLVNKAVLGLG
jgi:beta-hydroxylase